ncbi:hypothetical protein F4604DRAFT_1920586 [Suillus subluteus]|nr:hypothetical protein F4604DRAFT_1920586 [Suillus subluteus]
MPPRAKKQAKRKGLEVSKPQPKKARAAEPVEASSEQEVGMLNWRRLAQLLEGPSRAHRLKGSTSLDSTIPVNPQAPGPPRSKGRGRRPKAAPPPYSSSATTDVPNTSFVDVGTMESLQPLNLSIRQAGGRFGFATHAPTVPPDPYPNSQRPADTKKVTWKPARKIATGPGVADLVAPPAGFLYQNIDPALRGIHLVELRSAEADISSDAGSKDDDDEDEGDEEDEDEEDEEEDEEEEISHQQIGWGGGLVDVTLNIQDFLGMNPPHNLESLVHLHQNLISSIPCDEDDVVAQTSVSRTANPFHAVQPAVQQFTDASLTQPQPQEVQVTTTQPDDVLRRHHKRNGQPHLPDPETLELLHQVEKLDGPRPTQLAWYGPRWKCFLEDAKGECRAQHALENPFPALVADLPSSDGKQFEAGEHLFPLTLNHLILQFRDLATIKIQHGSAVVRRSCNLAIRFEEIRCEPGAPIILTHSPRLRSPFTERAKWVEHTAAALLEGSLFLRFGLDEYGIFLGENQEFCASCTSVTLLSVFFYMGLTESHASDQTYSEINCLRHV